MNKLISAYSLHNELLQDYPHVLYTLSRNFFFAIQNIQMDWRSTNHSLHALLYPGQTRKFGTCLHTMQQVVWEMLEMLLKPPYLRVDFTLSPGEILPPTTGGFSTTYRL